MKIVFATTQSPLQSTLIGRVMPLAEEFQKMGHEVTILVHDENITTPSRSPLYKEEKSQPELKIIGSNPFARTVNGKKRHSGMYLIWTMKMNAIRAAWQLIKIKPNVIIIVKPLPENTLAVKIAKTFLRHPKIILDVDDFELEANHLTSLPQRAAIHWSERTSARLASHIAVATPFLQDHMKLLAGEAKPVTVIPTGLPHLPNAKPAASHTLLWIGSVSIASGHRVDLLPQILERVHAILPDTNLIIAGSGDDEEKLKKEFAACNLTHAVEWAGRFTREDLPMLIGKASIILDVVDSNIANRAKSSYRAALSLNYGMPVVTSNVGIRTSIIPQQLHSKFFAAPGDAQSYSEKIISMLQKPISQEEVHLLQQTAKEYQYSHLAKVYYNCIV